MASPSLAPFNPTGDDAQQKALKLLNLKPDDLLVDVGCGDGRFLIRAVRSHSRVQCLGLEVDPVYHARAVAAKEKLSPNEQERLELRLGDATQWAMDQPVSAVYVFLLPDGLKAIRPLLEGWKERQGGIRIVSYMFQIPWWQPTEVERTSKGRLPLYYYDLR